jgi:hypothetical protein
VIALEGDFAVYKLTRAVHKVMQGCLAGLVHLWEYKKY